MKKYPLSTSAERTAGILFSLIMIGALILLMFVLKGNFTVRLLICVGVVLVVGILLLYILNVMKAACVYHPETNTLKVLGFQERTIDMNKVVGLQTIPVKSANVESRSLAFTDAEGSVVAIVPTYFTSKRGVLAEPMAMEMAADLGLTFQSNVPAWEYDEEAKKAHDIEVEEQEKKDAKARREARKANREARIRKKMDEMKKEK